MVLHRSPDHAYFWRVSQALHVARRANARTEVADCLDELEGIALHADSPRVKWLARRLVLAGAAETKRATPEGAAR